MAQVAENFHFFGFVPFRFWSVSARLGWLGQSPLVAAIAAAAAAAATTTAAAAWWWWWWWMASSDRRRAHPQDVHRVDEEDDVRQRVGNGHLSFGSIS